MTKMVPLLLVLSTLLLSVEGVCKTNALSASEQAVLDKHNELRALHEDTPKLCYGETGDDVTFSAQTWANTIANKREMYRSRCGLYNQHRCKYGENLAFGHAGTSGTVPERQEAYTSSTQGWYDGIKDWNFDSGKPIRAFSPKTGYFTQVVWKDTEQVNCGYATSNNHHRVYYSVVCQYYPSGDFVGEKALKNVAPLRTVWYDTVEWFDLNFNDFWYMFY